MWIFVHLSKENKNVFITEIDLDLYFKNFKVLLPSCLFEMLLLTNQLFG